MRRRKIRQIYLLDHPVFKALGIAVTLGVFGISYYFLAYVLGVGLSSPVGFLVPFVMVILCEALKQRQLWWIWLLGAALLLIGAVWLPLAAGYGYWLFSLVICIVQILIPSRGKVRSIALSEPEESAEPAPREIDDFLESLLDK